MAGLCWMAVMLAVFLSAENSLAVMDQNRLAAIVNGILREYGTRGMFSLAIRIPDNQNQNLNQILQQVFGSDPGNNVKNTINSGEVYIGNRVVAAKVLQRPTGGAEHAESRVVDHLDHLFNSNANDHDWLLFYVYASPCVEKCSSNRHRESILQRLNHIRQWDNYAVVFSTIFIPRTGQPNTDRQRSAALQRIGSSVGLDNIFRCARQDRWMQCTSCSVGGQVAPYCVSDS
ncbi:uncharacterized protein LOC119898593 [Micropterus salmoides]|uniref:uncharacterized protein LOC119898593 n=1 Tax=Micropterus salmoides TaxID=27706 RepID=UPI0018ED5C9E|nr:uncharacterized protein LOC119898593 [Micropterus salmoides]